MVTCLITGCGGFIGSHLAEHLVEQGHAVYGTVSTGRENIEDLRERMTILEIDIRDKAGIRKVIAKIKPNWIFHLAAQSLPGVSWQNPELTFNINILGTLYLLDSVRDAALDPVIVVFCSSGEYAPVRPKGPPIKEDHLLEPSSPYALSKLVQDYLSLLYWRAYRMRIIRVRPFFVIGPRKTGDVSSDFARGIVAVERGEKDWLEVGNLEAVRDFVDVRDAVVAFELVAEQGKAGEVYNVCVGIGRRVGDVLATLLAHAQKRVEVRQDPGRLRPLDEPVKVGDNTKLRQLGWRPTIPLQRTLADILAFWRDR